LSKLRPRRERDDSLEIVNAMIDTLRATRSTRGWSGRNSGWISPPESGG